jgi:ribosomal protein L11 methylase PrmA
MEVNGTYDIVLANIDIRTFSQPLRISLPSSEKGGLSPVSGILGRDKKELLSLFGSLFCLRVEQKNTWHGFIFQKNR